MLRHAASFSNVGDVQPWRKMLPLNNKRPRTPLQLSFDDIDARDYSDRSEQNSVLLVPEPTHTKRHSRPKFLTRASQYFGATKESKQDRLGHAFGKEQPKDLESTNIDSIVDTVFARVASNLGQPLSPQNNEPILRILEAYRELKVEKMEAKVALEETLIHLNTTLDALEGERKRWREDEASYKLEIRRLEILIANGKTGLSEVTLARQQSLLKRGSNVFPQLNVDMDKENSFAFRGKPQHGSEPFGVIKEGVRAPSPSQPMSILSQSLQQASCLPDTIPYGTRPRRDSQTFLKLSPLRSEKSDPTVWTARVGGHSSSVSKSTDEFSDFSSSGGDLLPDEIDQQELTAQAIEHVAKLIAEAKGSAVDDIVEILVASINGLNELEMCESSTAGFQQLTSVQPGKRVSLDRSSHHSQDTSLSSANLAKRRKVDLIHVHTTSGSNSTSTTSSRPFSFFAGDDSTTRLIPPVSAPLPLPPTPLSSSSSEGAVHSVSQPFLRDRSPSMIPSPVLEHPLLARPRRADREDSASSLVTSFERSPCGSILGRSFSGASNATAVRKNSLRMDSSGSRRSVRKILEVPRTDSPSTDSDIGDGPGFLADARLDSGVESTSDNIGMSSSPTTDLDFSGMQIGSASRRKTGSTVGRDKPPKSTVGSSKQNSAKSLKKEKREAAKNKITGKKGSKLAGRISPTTILIQSSERNTSASSGTEASRSSSGKSEKGCRK
ncbi:hypothetical protein EJ08DRAFT_734905 [Tothia fuscella]|uniref:Uncharacterized protein n=1 Tax=Tothia fuscella TaxID=1048955 RepID=A0A9P4TY58_9PEZI|nr:hypothetical protein EJ08DRAFT_734905 [Tothia fuscella]